jgi:glyoxylase-like metal-dependent hydrolase (beta-lactamase superfamily II)
MQRPTGRRGARRHAIVAMSTITARLFVAAAVLAAVAAARSARQEAPEAGIETVAVAGGVYMLAGSGGNIGLFVGEDGVFMIDDQFAPLTERILAAVAEITPQPVKFVINTHWHPDHTGGNENLGKAGAVIVAHENVRQSLSTDQFIREFGLSAPALTGKALPVVTFPESVTFHLNGEELHVFHVRNAHTDGDSIIHFRRANVLHMGDTFVNMEMYPFIDVEHGGSIDGMIAAVDRVLEMCDGETRVIPGHGPLGGPAELRGFRQMLATSRDRVTELIEQGRDRVGVIAAGPTRDLDGRWGGGYLKPDQWVGIVYDSLVRPAGR